VITTIWQTRLTNLLQPILVVCKPGIVQLWSRPDPISEWSGLRALPIPRQPPPVASSPLSPASGIIYVPTNVNLIVALSDGTFNVITGLFVEPMWSSSTESITAESLSTLARAVFAHTEQRDLKSSDVNRLSGAALYAESGIIAWTHELVFILRCDLPQRTLSLSKGSPNFRFRV
jgi:hypothetical protein